MGAVWWVKQVFNIGGFIVFIIVFFFKQKTAYEIKECDWSSDVCSSDLLGIFTGKGKQTSIITLKAVGVYKYFDMIITGDDVKEHKPSPEGINKFLNKFSLNKKDVLLIGDSPSDVKAARKAGIKIASAMWDSYAKSKVLELKSDYYFYTTKELKKFIEDNLHSI